MPPEIGEIHRASGGALTAADLAAVGRLKAALARVANVQRIRDLGVSRDGRAVQLQALAIINLGTEGPSQQLVAGLRHVIRASGLPGDLRAHLAGQVAAQASNRAVNLAQDLSIVFIIALLLALVLRSLVAPFYLIASVALSYLAAFGLSVLVFQIIGGTGGLKTLHPVPDVRVPAGPGRGLQHPGDDPDPGGGRRRPAAAGGHPGLGRTGSTVTSGGLVLADTFGVFAVMVGGQPGGAVYRAILASLAIGLLIDAFLVRTLLVPSTVALLGRWNWWPSAHGRREGLASAAARLTGPSAALTPKG